VALIDDVMPTYDRREIHRRAIGAPDAAVWEAVHELRGDELPLARTLMAIRTLGRDRSTGRTVLENFRRMGFRTIAEDPGRELVVGGVGRFWRASGGLVRLDDREHFTGFDQPGYAKVAFNFTLEGGVLSTETRIAGTDPQASRRFALYWLAVRPGSGLIRREWLRAIAKRAFASNQTRNAAGEKPAA
jgi:hypothetical protein